MTLATNMFFWDWAGAPTEAPIIPSDPTPGRGRGKAKGHAKQEPGYIKLTDTEWLARETVLRDRTPPVVEEAPEVVRARVLAEFKARAIAKLQSELLLELRIYAAEREQLMAAQQAPEATKQAMQAAKTVQELGALARELKILSETVATLSAAQSARIDAIQQLRATLLRKQNG